MTWDDSRRRAVRESLLAVQRGDDETASLITRALPALGPPRSFSRTLVLRLVRLRQVTTRRPNSDINTAEATGAPGANLAEEPKAG